MALVYTTSYSNEIESLSLVSLQVPADHLTVTSETPEMVSETLISAPLDRPEVWDFGKKDIANVYADTTIPPSAKPASSRGVQIIVRHTSVTTVTDPDDSSFLKMLPFSSRLVVRAPINELMTADLVKDEVLRCIGGAFGTTASSARISDLLKGALKAN